MQLLQAFKDFVDKEALFSSNETLLVAVSGGMDSVVLCELCCRAGFDLIIAHVNFQLRGEESVRDEAFVREMGRRLGKQVMVERFDTTRYASEKKCSIQVAARELRYQWFEQVHAGPILTAHHQDDNIETLLMNFFKGTGIAGLRGIQPRQGRIVRPLLFATKEMLRQFAGEQGLSWVEDSSNASDKYTRNYFRHQLIPLLQSVYPGVTAHLADNIQRFREIEVLYRQGVEQYKKKLLEKKGEEVHIPVEKLRRSQPLHTLIYEIIHPLGFSPQQVSSVVALLDAGSGKYVLSASHRILKDRNWLIISPLAEAPADHVLIESPAGKVLYEGGTLDLQLLTVQAPTADASIAWLDTTAMQFPLLLRKWRPGDYFYPLGMRKKKKLARFFIDNKLSLAQKEKVWVLEMDKKIIWVVGMRIDDRFRITERTKQVLRIAFLPR
ncbi:tRNA lysidine(34) synthetase TilS [Flavitalea sp. BT771]|uniref:tRNA lysidine(34) synthetase TilS n=1 Tax=Flavitalea sp. BT771 TaxID=3063329 RepID=UPI0026E3D42C|nr:tRNA lysidine(34) synthetase TilS [Flavitalea sp. BT771]MDO6435345.1 tRNA lysidine(34) synthetase TilS [Flavitalea sp. BT771]MDV6224295.1 tRNA lysidine(34) synthetase TilS [Flavitalea sp. BT771]